MKLTLVMSGIRFEKPVFVVAAFHTEEKGLHLALQDVEGGQGKAKANIYLQLDFTPEDMAQLADYFQPPKPLPTYDPSKWHRIDD